MILLLGGTGDTRHLAEALVRAGFRILVSTASDTPLDLGADLGPEVRRRSGPLDRAGLRDLLGREGVQAVVDATHPYAREIRTLAPEVCREVGVPYLTYVRPPAAGGAVLTAADHDAAARLAFSLAEPVLLTTGSRNLEPYAREARRTGIPLTVRVLPGPESREACRRAAVPGDRVIASRGPFGVEENRRMIRESGARVLVTKDGGIPGGVPQKLEAARREGCRVVVVARPAEARGAHADVASLVKALRRVRGEIENGLAAVGRGDASAGCGRRDRPGRGAEQTPGRGDP